MNKIFAIGDIHGCLEKLEKLMNQIAVNREKDTIVFIGDYIDRGKSSKEVVDYVIHLREQYENVVCLLGNHEKMFLQYLDGFDESLYLGNGGANTLSSYDISLLDDSEKRKKRVSIEHQSFYKSLLPYYESAHHMFVHAGIRPGLPLEKQTMDDLLWIRYEFIQCEKDFGKRVVFGHTPFTHPLIQENKIGIDTGAVYGGKLTCLELPALKIYQS